jgi:hypothetical protein
MSGLRFLAAVELLNAASETPRILRLFGESAPADHLVRKLETGADGLTKDHGQKGLPHHCKWGEIPLTYC